MPVCIKCRCEIETSNRVCPWCGTSQKSPINYRKTLLVYFTIIALISFAMFQTWPLLWDTLFQLGLRQPLLNFSKLEQLLQAGDWEQVDRETSGLLNRATQSSNDLNPVEMQTQRLSCADLQALDQLWLQYSNGRFGFSVQRRIYGSRQVYPATPQPLEQPTIDSSSPNTRSSNNASSALQTMSDILASQVAQERSFRTQIGWGWSDDRTSPVAVDDPAINFSLTAPSGHLPSYGVFLSSSSNILPLFSTRAFAERQKQCGL